MQSNTYTFKSLTNEYNPEQLTMRIARLERDNANDVHNTIIDTALLICINEKTTITVINTANNCH